MAGIPFFLICAAIGLFAGVVAGLLGVGGGVIMVPAFTRFLGMDIRMAIGTSMVIIVLTAMVAGAKHYQLGHVDFRIVFIVAGLSMVGGYAGASLTQQFSVRTLQMIFAVFILIVGTDMFIKAWNATPEPPPPSLNETSP
jgi:uncharacterized membrane protein YfcA